MILIFLLLVAIVFVIVLVDCYYLIQNNIGKIVVVLTSFIARISKYKKVFIYGSVFIAFILGLYYFPTTIPNFEPVGWYITMLFDIGKVIFTSVLFAMVVSVYKLYADNNYWGSLIDTYCSRRKKSRYTYIETKIEYNLSDGDYYTGVTKLINLFKILYTSRDKYIDGGDGKTFTNYYTNKKLNSFEVLYRNRLDYELCNIRGLDRLKLFLSVHLTKDNVSFIETFYNNLIVNDFEKILETKIDKIAIYTIIEKSHTPYTDIEEFKNICVYLLDNFVELLHEQFNPVNMWINKQPSSNILYIPEETYEIILKTFLTGYSGYGNIEYLCDYGDIKKKQVLFNYLIQNNILCGYNGNLNDTTQTKKFLDFLKKNRK